MLGSFFNYPDQGESEQSQELVFLPHWDDAKWATLLKYTEQGIKNIKESPSRLEKAKQALRALGGELKSFHLVQGRYDAIVFSEAPNDEVAAKFALATGSQGNVRTETFRAFTEDEYRKLVSGLP